MKVLQVACISGYGEIITINSVKSYVYRGLLKRMPSKTYKDANGYWRFKDSDIPVHRWVAEKKLGRELRPGEVVHHKDRNKDNNDPDNLWVFSSQEEHDRMHEDAYRHGDRASYQGFSRSQDDWYDDDEEDDDDDYDS